MNIRSFKITGPPKFISECLIIIMGGMDNKFKKLVRASESECFTLRHVRVGVTVIDELNIAVRADVCDLNAVFWHKYNGPI